MNKFRRIVWTINGILIFFLGLFLMYMVAKELYNSVFPPYDDGIAEVIVGDQLEEAKKKGLALQGLDYGEPQLLVSKNYILPVQIKTFDTPKELGLKFYAASGSIPYATQNTINIVFLRPDFSVDHALLDKKAYIIDYKYPRLGFPGEIQVDSLRNCITYQIAFQDSDNDGSITAEDNSDLYITDINGNGLHQITKDVDVFTYSFTTSNTILITYFKRDDTLDEHKKVYFALYTVNKKELKELTSLHQQLDDLEKMIIQ